MRYLCVADSSAGFTYVSDKQQWEPRIFRTKTKWLIRPAAEAGKIEIVRFGTEDAVYSCPANFTFGGNVLQCDGVGSFFFNRKNGRFEARGYEAYALKDVLPGAEGEADVWMEIGVCSAI